MEIEEAKLIERAIKGNLDAFNRLVLMYQSIVYNTALRILYDEDLADDLTQTAFVSAWQHINSFKGESFKPWIMRITINACYDELRRQRRHPNMPLEPTSVESDEEYEDAPWMIDQSPQPLEVYESSERIAQLEACLKKLPEDYRSVLVMIDVQEMNYQEVSDVLDKPLGTVKSRLFRARIKLRDCLKNHSELFGFDRRYDDKEDLRDDSENE